MTTGVSTTRDVVVPLGHATVRLDLGGVRVLTDPVLRRRMQFLVRATPLPDVPSAVDAVLISHLHHDHCDLPSLKKVLARSSAEPTIVVPVGAGRFLRHHLAVNPVELAVGEHVRIGEVTVTAVRAVHDGRREPWGPRAEAVGYVLSVADSARTVYFAGDTDLFPEMRDLAPSLDLALVPLWGWGPRLGPGHLNPERAAEAVGQLRPERVLPIHYGTYLPVGLRRLPIGARTLNSPIAEFREAVARRGLPVEILTGPAGVEVPWREQ